MKNYLLRQMSISGRWGCNYYKCPHNICVGPYCEEVIF